MKQTLTLATCLALALVGCDKSKPNAATKSPPAGGTSAGTQTAAPTPPPPPPGGTAAATPPPATGAVDGFKFPSEVHKVGDKRVEVETRDMAMDIEVEPGKTVRMNGTETATETKEVLAVDGNVITKLKISYSAMKETQTMGGKSKDKPSPVDGKTYLVWREGDELKVSYEDGSAPPDPEAKEVRKGNRGVGRPEPLEEFMAGVTWKTGTKVEFNADQLAKMNQNMGGDNEPTLTAMSFTLQTADDAVATLVMTMAMALKGPDGEMKFDLAGTAKVDRKTGRPLEVAGTGPFAGFAKAKMSGTMTMKTAYTY